MYDTMTGNLQGAQDAFKLERTLSGATPSTAPLYVVIFSSLLDLVLFPTILFASAISGLIAVAAIVPDGVATILDAGLRQVQIGPDSFKNVLDNVAG